ncbi:MAG: hypothetical protein M3P83_04360 [Actinomycetota bacterium]|nr:hypothetical protein [Actinomycetota bacterium]
MADASLWLFTGLVALVALERLAELAVSARNLRWSRERGAVEFGFGHYVPMVVLHGGLLAGAVLEVWVRRPDPAALLASVMLALVLLAQILRWWCVATLGRQWNTRVIVVPGMSLVRRGPYRWLAHPNYVAVVVEGFALPMVHAAWITAVAFSLLNAALLTIRIRVENVALTKLAGDPGAA